MNQKTKKEIIQYLKDAGISVEGEARMRVIDHTNNILAPEVFCYKIYWKDSLGMKRKLAVWPNTVGYQGF